jgi:hypothetical protein
VVKLVRLFAGLMESSSQRPAGRNNGRFLASKRLIIIAFGAAVCTLSCIAFSVSMGLDGNTVLEEGRGPYNVRYFSTFLVPTEHFTRGGLHQAAIPYERQLRKQGVVDDDGVHYLSSSQVSLLNLDLNSKCCYSLRL